MSHRHPPTHRHPVEPGVRLKRLLVAMAALPTLAVWWWAWSAQAMPQGLRYVAAAGLTVCVVAWAMALSRLAPRGFLLFHEGHWRWASVRAGAVPAAGAGEPVAIELRLALDAQWAVLVAVRADAVAQAGPKRSTGVQSQASPGWLWLFAADVPAPAWLALRRCLAAPDGSSVHAAPSAGRPLV